MGKDSPTLAGLVDSFLVFKLFQACIFVIIHNRFVYNIRIVVQNSGDNGPATFVIFRSVSQLTS